jgi:O-antigen/teichoic acid export membrane protein
LDTQFKKNFLKGSASVGIGQTATIIFHLLSTIIITRHISKDDFGTFALINAIYIALQLLGGLGLDKSLVKYLSSERKERLNQLFLSFLIFRMASLITIGIIFLVITHFFVLFDQTVNSYIILICIIFILSSLRDFYYAQLQGIKQFKALAIIQVVSAASKFTLYGLGLIFNKLNLDYLVYTEIGFLFLSFVVQQFLVKIEYNFHFKINFQEIKDIFKFSIPLYFNDLLALANNRTNAFIISGFLNNTNLAYYRVAGTIPDGLNRLYSAFGIVFYPNVSTLFSEKGYQETGSFIDRSLLSVTLLVAPILLLTYLIKEDITVLLFSEKYLESSFAFFLFILVFYFKSISNISGYSIVSSGNSLSSFKINIFSVLIGIGASLVLTPLIGFEGAIYSSLLSSILSSFLGILFLKKLTLDLNLLKYLYPLGNCTIFILIYFFIGLHNIFFSLFVFAVFLIIQWLLFKEFRSLLKTLYDHIFLNKFFRKGKQ